MERRNTKTRTVGNGEGSLYYSKALKCWIYQYYVENDPARKTMKQKKNETVKDFKARVTELKNKLNNGTYISKSSATIYSLGVEIIENKYRRNKIGDNSYSREVGTLKLIKNSALKDIPIQKATFYQIQKFLDETKKYSNSYIDKIYGMLNRIFNEAIKRDYIIKSPMIKTEKPKSDIQEKKIEAFTIDEQKSFLSVLPPKEIYSDIFIIAVYSGMRMGEILALKKEDINFESMEIHIRRTLTKTIFGKTKLGETTKTYCSDRIIPITPLFEKELRHAISNSILNINNLIFVQPNGKIISVSNMNSRFNRLCCNAKLSVRPYTIERKNEKTGTIKTINSVRSNYNQHMLRHTYATRMIEAGVPAEVLQRLLGHRDIQTTINTYATIFDKYKKEQVDKYVTYIKHI